MQRARGKAVLSLFRSLRDLGNLGFFGCGVQDFVGVLGCRGVGLRVCMVYAFGASGLVFIGLGVQSLAFMREV